MALGAFPGAELAIFFVHTDVDELIEFLRLGNGCCKIACML
jgi:hypothetical protein